jgi:hypothetical protein
MAKSRAEAMVAAIRSVTADWAKQRRSEERHAANARKRVDRMLRKRGVSTKEAAFAVMAESYAKASDGGALPANARQIMYAARPGILRITGKDSLDDAYFTQQLLPDFIEIYPEICADWDVVYDARGSLIEPHTGTETAIGTLEVREYLNGRGAAQRSTSIRLREEERFPTHGPENRYKAILFIESPAASRSISTRARTRFTARPRLIAASSPASSRWKSGAPRSARSPRNCKHNSVDQRRYGDE